MAKTPTPEQEDRRQISRERRSLIAERVEHVNRIKGLLFARGVADYQPVRRNRRQQLEALRTGDGRSLPICLKQRISRELDRLELLLEQTKTVEGIGCVCSNNGRASCRKAHVEIHCRARSETYGAYSNGRRCSPV